MRSVICRRRVRFAQQVAQRRPQGRLGEAAQRHGLLFEGPGPGELRNSRQQRDAPLCDPQPPHQSWRILPNIFITLDGRGDVGKDRVDPFLEEARQEAPTP